MKDQISASIIDNLSGIRGNLQRQTSAHEGSTAHHLTALLTLHGFNSTSETIRIYQDWNPKDATTDSKKSASLLRIC